MIGKTLGSYKVVAKLGEGGMGVVYEAEDTQLGRRVALKFLPETRGTNLVALERFQREARAASALNHPNICTVYAIGQHEGRHFIAMELLEGQTLAQSIGTQPFTPAALVEIGVQIADALESAHAKGIVHRDIKPANVFVNPRGRVKLLDFGLAKFGGSADLVAQAETRVGPDLTMPGTAMGTVAYMSPEQARGELTDARTDLFSLGAVLYQMATGVLPFKGDTDAVVFDAILNREPPPVSQITSAVPDALSRVIEKALEKDRALRYQSATELRTDLFRIRRDLESGRKAAAHPAGETPSAGTKAAERSIAVLFFENLSGVKEDEYFRDGVTEDIITELSKIRGLNTFSRPTVLAFRDKPVTPAQIGQQLGAAYVLAGSLRRAGARLRINAQLVDTRTDFPLWSERYDREMRDVFEVQDEIARKIAEALRITLSPQEQAALSAKPTDNLQAYDLYLRGKSYARRLTQQDLEFALQMFESAIGLESPVCAGLRGNRQRLRAASLPSQVRLRLARSRARRGGESRVAPAAPARSACRPRLGLLREQAVQRSGDGRAHGHRAEVDCEGVYYMLGRALFAAGRCQEILDVADEAVRVSGSDYNIYMPIVDALKAMGKPDAERHMNMRHSEALESHLREVPDDPRARMPLAITFASLDRADDAIRQANLATMLRPTSRPCSTTPPAHTACSRGSPRRSRR